MRERHPCVYILANGRNGTFYIGVTSNLIQRIYQHRQGEIPGFTSRYKVALLMWFEMHGTMEGAIRREKSIKRWRREFKMNLIEQANPQWNDLTIGSGFDALKE